MYLSSIKNNLSKYLIGHICLSFLLFNIAYTSGMLPSCPSCAQSSGHEHSEPSISAETHQHDNSTHHNISTATVQADSSDNHACSCSDGRCCSEFYHDHMVTMISTGFIQSEIVTIGSLVIPVQVKATNFIIPPENPPPIYIS